MTTSYSKHLRVSVPHTRQVRARPATCRLLHRLLRPVEKAAAQARLDALKRESVAGEARLQAQFRARLESLKREVDEAKAGFLQRTQALQRAYDAAMKQQASHALDTPRRFA